MTELARTQEIEQFTEEPWAEKLLAIREELRHMDVDGLRKFINGCDGEMLFAEAKRQLATDQIGHEKSRLGINVYQHQVELAKLKWVEERSIELDLDPKMTVPFWVGIMGRSKDRQNAIKYQAGNSAVANMFDANDRV